MKNILITGITGQDGIFLTSKLLDEYGSDVKVIGITRKENDRLFFNKLSTINDKSFSSIKLLKLNLLNKESVQKLIKDVKFDFVYNLSGPSSVYDSLKNKSRTELLIYNYFNNLISAFKKADYFPSFFQASSSEMFGNVTNESLVENSRFSPNSPYAESKLKVHKLALDLRDDLGWKICCGIMFNHESEFRKKEYLFMKIIQYVEDLNKNGFKQKLKIGSLNIKRDWSFAGDICEAIYLISHFANSSSYVLGSGKSVSINYIIDFIFKYYDLNYKDFVVTDKKLLRKGDPNNIISNPQKIKKELGWEVKYSIDDLLIRCIQKKFT